jgi:Dolichyl-phosphate-mannose-protein mannosyltransferase
MKRVFWLLLAVALPRVAVFFVNENLGGDAIARTWLAHRWLESPHLITSFDGGAKQFGPLHIYLLAWAEFVWPSILHAGRMISLVAGVLTAWPLFSFTRRRFGAHAATLAVLGLACWGLHVQCSTTSASEALNLLWVMSAIAAFDLAAEDPRAGWWAALFLNLACATRYDSWLLVPLLAVAQWARTRRLWPSVAFGAAASVFAVSWLIGNFSARGDPLFPIKFIDQFHRDWWPSEAAIWGEGRYRAMCLLFWPGAALVMLTPAFALPGMAALGRLWREHRDLRWFAALIVVPAVLYGMRGAVFASFAPLARFTVKEVLLLLPLAGWWLSTRTPLLRWGAVCLAAAWCVGLGVFTFKPDAGQAYTLRSISPTSRLESSLRAPIDWLRGQGDGLLVVDEDPAGFDDLPITYFSALPFDQQVRRRFERYTEALGARVPRHLVLFEGGRLVGEGAVTVVSEREVTFRQRRFQERFVGRRVRIFELVP